MIEFLSIPKTIVLVGMLGAGKTSIGRRLAKHLGLAFADSDQEVELAANCSIEDIYDLYGEAAFQEVEMRVIKRLLENPVHVLSTGGGAFIHEPTRHLIQAKGISIWIRAAMETILPRVERRDHRPQLKSADKRQKLEDLIEQYYPIYAQADIIVDSDNSTPDAMTARIVQEINRYISLQQKDANQRIQHA